MQQAMHAAHATRAHRALALTLPLLAVAAAVMAVPTKGHVPAACEGNLACLSLPATIDDRSNDHHQADPRQWLLGERLDINQATAAQLERISGIGPAMAARIIEARTARGGFTDIAQLDDIRGIGAKTLAKLRVVLEVRAP
jgi:competence ComEA-like helix-hairpin-helix protein